MALKFTPPRIEPPHEPAAPVADPALSVVAESLSRQADIAERQAEAMDRLSAALARSGNKIIKAVVERDGEQRIASITMHVTLAP